VNPMNLFIQILTGLLVGAGTGMFFYGLLYLTVQQLRKIRRPVFIMVGGFLLRAGITLLIFYLLLAGENVVCLISAVTAFVMVRVLWVRRIREPRKSRAPGGVDAHQP